MKNSLSSQYKALFREELQSRGFLLYKKTFYRVINDVVQTVMLCKTSATFTVDFNILPLCLQIKDLYCEGFDISVFRKEKGGWYCWEGCDIESELRDILSLFRQHVIPIFDKGVDTKSAYEELIRLEKMIYTGVPGGVIMNNYKYVMMCVKANDYERAYQHMAAIITQNIGYIADCEKESIEDFSPNIQERLKELHRLSIPDVEYFQNMIAENEALSLECLKCPRYPGERK